jgi:simple sugar transport system permease protein
VSKLSKLWEDWRKGRDWTGAIIPVLAVITALIVGAFVILIARANVVKAYAGLFEGMLGSPRAIANTLVEATPYILAGLSVALGFKAGLFNIGAEGQFYLGALASVVVGYSLKGLPMIIHLPLAMLAGALAGALWGAIPGFLKAKLGAHEVINTIMMNYIAVKLVDYLVKSVIRDPKASLDRTPYILPSATLPPLLGEGYSLHSGLILALAAVGVVYWLLYRTKIGFEIRTVGANPNAARYAGMSVPRTFVLTMSLAGALAGLAGVSQVLGLSHMLPAAFSSGYGFDSIAVALLAQSNPFAIVPAALLWGGLRNGAGLMQVRAGISIDLINIIQGLVIMFIAADQIVRWIYRLRARRGGEAVFTRGWGR